MDTELKFTLRERIMRMFLYALLAALFSYLLLNDDPDGWVRILLYVGIGGGLISALSHGLGAITDHKSRSQR